MQDNHKKLHILFISRAFPPIIGGIENQNDAIFRHLSQIAEVTLLANTRGKQFLPLFLPYVLWRCLFLAHKHDVILLGDGLLAVVGWWVRLFSNTPIACFLHGLDLTFTNPMYQALWVKHFLLKMDALFLASQETIHLAAQKGIPLNRCYKIHNGVDLEAVSENPQWAELEALAGRPLQGRFLLLTLGRLIERKGVEWFISHVIPRLNSDVIYLVAGEGPMRPRITEAIHRLGLENRVILLGSVSDSLRRTLYQAVDVFVQPNIPVAGDVEGFGLVMLEAAVNGLPIVASRLDGLKDSVCDGESGILVTPNDVDGFLSAIDHFIRDEGYRKKFGCRAKSYVLANYHWPVLAERYLEVLQKVTNDIQS